MGGTATLHYDPGMGIELRWVGEADLDRVAETHLRCYGKSAGELEAFKLRLRNDPRAGNQDYLLAEVDGQAVGTATHLSYRMWVRGGSVPCQGVAWVGAIKTMRRRGTAGAAGIASTVMCEMIRHARDRGDVVTALMPFRASYYEHFGYGIVERRFDWTVPISAFPTGPFESLRYFNAKDFEARAQCLQRVNQAGQCDIERSGEYWKQLDLAALDGFTIVDREGDGPVRGSFVFHHQHIDGKDLLRVSDCIYQDSPALKRQLYFLASLKDQFAAALISLPCDVPLNRLLRENQIPHRPVNHDVPRYAPCTRMQVRVLDHSKFLQALHLPDSAAGRAVVAVHECEGHVSRFAIDIHGGHARCQQSDATADFECTDATWAGIACGDLKASDAILFGLASGGGAPILDALAQGPMPFSHEYF